MLHWARVALILTTLGAVAAALGGCAGAPQTPVARGAAVWKTCVPCHGTDGGGSMELRAPAIAGLPDWYVSAQLTKFKSDIRGAHPDDMEGHRMRPMARTLYHEGDLEAVSAHVAAMPKVRPSPAYGGHADTTAGRTTYQGICVTCHGDAGLGNKDLGAPPLVGQPDWYLMSQLQKFHSGMRGTHPEDVFGAQMRAMSLTLADTTAMHDVVAFIKTLPH